MWCQDDPLQRLPVYTALNHEAQAFDSLKPGKVAERILRVLHRLTAGTQRLQQTAFQWVMSQRCTMVHLQAARTYAIPRHDTSKSQLYMLYATHVSRKRARRVMARK